MKMDPSVRSNCDKNLKKEARVFKRKTILLFAASHSACLFLIIKVESFFGAHAITQNAKDSNSESLTGSTGSIADPTRNIGGPFGN